MARNDIEFAASDPDIPFDDPQALTNQKPASKIFSKLADLTMVQTWIV
jgi:hypothetical protein